MAVAWVKACQQRVVEESMMVLWLVCAVVVVEWMAHPAADNAVVAVKVALMHLHLVAIVPNAYAVLSVSSADHYCQRCHSHPLIFPFCEVSTPFSEVLALETQPFSQYEELFFAVDYLSNWVSFSLVS